MEQRPTGGGRGEGVAGLPDEPKDSAGAEPPEAEPRLLPEPAGEKTLDSTEDQDEEDTVFEEMEGFPAPLENDSSGTTAIFVKGAPAEDEDPTPQWGPGGSTEPDVEPQPESSGSSPSSPPAAPEPEAAGTARPETSEKKTETGSSRPCSAPPTAAGRQTLPPNLILIILASYASAVTLALLLLLSRGGGAKPHHLESLPDVQPEPVGELSYVPVHAELAPGHRLELGEKQRFGNILVEPMRILREPVEFVHYSQDPSKTRPPSAPVWKLWLRFTNVSDQQEIAPLDRDLMLRWVVRSEDLKEYSNYYIAPRGAAQDADVIQAYRLPSTSDWDMKSQQLGKVLAPGESVETYIATTEEDLDLLSGDLVWRFQIRKGYSPSGNGVTTMVEVAFNPDGVTGSGSGSG